MREAKSTQQKFCRLTRAQGTNTIDRCGKDETEPWHHFGPQPNAVSGQRWHIGFGARPPAAAPAGPTIEMNGTFSDVRVPGVRIAKTAANLTSASACILHQAAFQMCVGAVKSLLEQGADPMSEDSFGQIPVHMACAIGTEEDSEVFEMLLEASSDPDHKDVNGDTPLHMAARSGFPNGIYLLGLDGRVDFTARNSSGNTPLHEALDPQNGVNYDDSVIDQSEISTAFA
ncbi:hypothetical protein N7451_006459 [Penicillium sp. IBT 35674x]|nr:hypothetical protein N7451_006459 [Penicillium sp. IBT 35674x]